MAATGGDARAASGVRMSALLKDVLVIPERAGTEDYVLRLTDSVGSGSQRALDEYVVTPALVDSFDSALALVAEAVSSRTSRGAFLAGSFGSGKSHFMAVLHALLRRDAGARSKTELQGVVARHDPVLAEKKILPLVFHLLGAESMEAALFAGYERQVRELHPGAPLPALHRSDGVLADAENQRRRMGDEAFFSELNGGDAPADAWSGLLGTGTWTAATYDAARAASPGNEERQKLVTALAAKFFTSYTQQAAWVDLDTGLVAVAAHAKALGYDAVVLFLDELVLWLAFAVQDRDFFRRESQKLTKLVEAGAGQRAIPLVSFVARQMDLRRWFADAGASGAEQDALDTAFRHQEGRFATITLGDDNLPYVARQRVLQRRDDADGDQVIGDALSQLERRQAVWDVLLDGVNTDESHRGADEAAFKLTYPFSPALVSTLRSLASVMQRERTALKVMQQMLVDQRESLTVDEVIPVGDAYEYIVTGQSALDSTIAALFRSATRLYEDKLRPLMLAGYNLTEDAVAALVAAGTPLPRGFLADDRLAKTLLLAALAPNVPALKEITASRLASLNHGSIVSPLPGAEASTVLTKVRGWAREVPQLKVDVAGRNPVIRVQLSDVDFESVVERAKGEDNDGRRRELVKDLVARALGIPLGNPDVLGVHRHSIVWRGSRREVDVVFGNVRDVSWLTEEHFRARPGTWRVVIDHPFDDAGHSAAEDLARVDRLREGGMDSRTVVWLPRFLSEDRMREVRRLVVLEWLLTGSGERWTASSDHLSEIDRHQARGLLEQERTARTAGLERAIQEAYGAAAPSAGTLVADDAHDRVLVSLDRGFTPAEPVGADLASAFAHLLDQALASSCPSHPRFEPGEREVAVKELVAVHAHVERAMADPDHRVRLEGDVAAVRRVATPLGVGTAAETYFILTEDRLRPWATEITKAMSREGVGQNDAVTVAQLRDWIAAVEPAWGLRPEVADLVLLTWGALRQRAWHHFGASIATPRPGALRPEMELRTQAMPLGDHWQRATARAAVLFGTTTTPYLTAARVSEFTQQVQAAVEARTREVAALVPAVDKAYGRVGRGDDGGRLATARAAEDLLTTLARAGGPVPLIDALATTASPSTDEVLATSIARAGPVARAVESYRWERLARLRGAARDDGPRAASARVILGRIEAAVAAEEFASSLAPVLEASENDVFAWFEAETPAPVPPPAPKPEPRVDPAVAPGRAGRARVAPGARTDGVEAALRAFLREHPHDAVVVDWRVE